MKSFHPLFKSAVVGINILDMVNTSNDSNSSREIDGAMGNSEAVSHRPVDGSAITTENGIFCQDSPQRRLIVFLSSAFNMKSAVAPERSRTTNTGTWSLPVHVHGFACRVYAVDDSGGVDLCRKREKRSHPPQ